MQYCEKCKVKIRGHKEVCPLCHGSLTGTPEDPAFPVIEHPKISSFSVRKISAFVFVVFEVIMGISRMAVSSAPGWIVFAMLLAVYLLFAEMIILYYRANPVKVLHYGFYLAMIFLLIVDNRTRWHAWSVQYAIPWMFAGLVFLTVLVEKINHMILEDYIIYFIFDVLMSLLQGIWIANGLNRRPLTAWVSIGFMVITAAGIMIFRSRELKNAGRKYLHL